MKSNVNTGNGCDVSGHVWPYDFREPDSLRNGGLEVAFGVNDRTAGAARRMKSANAVYQPRPHKHALSALRSATIVLRYAGGMLVIFSAFTIMSACNRPAFSHSRNSCPDV